MASLSARRSMFIDDHFSILEYSGAWLTDNYSDPGMAFRYIGSAAKQTAHGTTSTGGFAFSFEGTSLSIEGQSNVIPATTNSSLRCTVDGVEANSDVVNETNLRHWHLCAATGLSLGRHDVVVNITAGSNTAIWLDAIYYFSLPNPNLRRKTSMFLPNTNEFRFTSVNWISPFDTQGISGRETYANGSKVTIPFYGISVDLTAYLTSQMPRAAGSGSYSVDGGPAVRFEIPAWTPGFRGLPTNETMRRVLLFTTPPVAPGQHTIEITNLGSAETVPLSIDYVYVAHGDVDEPATTATGVGGGAQSTATTSTSTPKASSGTPTSTETRASITDISTQKAKPGPIIGGVVGGLAVLAIVGFLIYLWLAKRRKSSRVPETQVLLTGEDAPNLSMQSRGVAVPFASQNTGTTPPAYSA